MTIKGTRASTTLSTNFVFRASISPQTRACSEMSKQKK